MPTQPPKTTNPISVAILAAAALALIMPLTSKAQIPAQILAQIPAPVTVEAAITAPFAAVDAPIINQDAVIGIARLDKGRLIPTPRGERLDWGFLDKRSALTFKPISAAAHLATLPDIPMNGRDSDNRIDEIRMTAADLGMDYIVLYAIGDGAKWGSFGGKAMMQTGLKVSDTLASPAAQAKAVLVDTYDGTVYGIVTSDKADFGVGELSEKVEALTDKLANLNAVQKA